MYSLPFQNNTYFGVGPSHNETANVLNIQPVLPFTFGDVNIISRTIAPLIYLPGLSTDTSDITSENPFNGSHFGLGDINQSLFFSPANSEGLIWGVGPAFSLPTATATPLGSGKFSIAPRGSRWLHRNHGWSGYWRASCGRWRARAIAECRASCCCSLSSTTTCPRAGIWRVRRSSRRTGMRVPATGGNFPIGGGIGKILKIDDQPINVGLQAFDYVQSPTGGPCWMFRFQVQFLFPR